MHMERINYYVIHCTFVTTQYPTLRNRITIHIRFYHCRIAL